MSNIASLKDLRCPKCGSDDILPIGKKGAAGGEIAAAFFGGAIANLAVSSSASKQSVSAAEPLSYRCKACKNKFTSLPFEATDGDVLSVPCRINFTRQKSFVGAAVVQMVYLNGISCGPIKNGKTISFHTESRWNTLFVTDAYGVAFPDIYRFEAVPGGEVNVSFNRKFV